MTWGSSPIATLAENLGTNGGTSSAIDTTGADTIFLFVGSNESAAPTVSDSKSNSYASALIHTVNPGPSCRLYMIKPSSVGSGHTFTVSLSGGKIGLAVMAFAGGAASPTDQTNGASGNFSATRQPGSITPSEANCLVVTGVAFSEFGATVDNINESYAAEIEVTGADSNFGVGMSYKVQTTAVATNPTWTLTASSSWIMAIIASFKTAAAAGGAVRRGRGLMGIGH